LLKLNSERLLKAPEVERIASLEGQFLKKLSGGVALSSSTVLPKLGRSVIEQFISARAKELALVVLNKFRNSCLARIQKPVLLLIN
jgi:hypothetical protein